MANRSMDILIEAIDNASGTMEEVAETGEESASSLETSFLAVTAVLGGVTAGVEILQRRQAELRKTLKNVAFVIGSQEKRLRNIISTVANVTRPVDELVQAFDLLQERGIENEDAMAQLAVQYDTLADAIGGDIPTTLKETSRLLGLFGEGITDVVEYQDQLTYLFRRTPMELEDMNTMLRRGSDFLTDYNLTLDEGITLLATTAREMQDGKTAVRTFRQSAREAEGDLNKLYESLGINEEQLADMKDELENAGGLTDEFAQHTAEQFTLIQRVNSIIDRLKIKYSEIFELLSTLAPVILGVVVGLYAMVNVMPAIVTGAGKVWGALKALSTAIIGWKALILAIPVAVAFAVEYMTDESANLRREVDKLENKIGDVNDVLGLLGQEDVSLQRQQMAIRSFRDDIIRVQDELVEKGLLPEEAVVTSRENLTGKHLEAYKKYLQGALDETQKELESADTGGIVSEKIVPVLNNAKKVISEKLSDLAGFTSDKMHGVFDWAEVQLFGEMDFSGSVEELLNKINKNSSSDVLASEQGIIDITGNHISAINDLADAYAGTNVEYDKYLEKTDIYSKAISDLLDLSKVGVDNENIAKYADEMIESANKTEDNEQAVAILSNAYTTLRNEGLDPTSVLAIKLKDNIKKLSAGIESNEGTTDEAVSTLQRLGQQYEETSLLAEQLGEDYDKNSARMNIAQRAIENLISTKAKEGKLTDEQREKLEKWIKRYNEAKESLEEDSTSQQSDKLAQLSNEYEKATLMAEQLGDSYSEQSNKSRIAQSAIEHLIGKQAEQGELTKEQEEQLEKWIQRWEDAQESMKGTGDEVDNTNKALQSMFNRFDKLPEIGEKLDWTDVDTRQLSQINSIIQRMIMEGREEIELADGRVIKMNELLEMRENLTDEQKKQEGIWGSVIDKITNSVPVLGKITDIIENATDKDISFDFSAKMGDISEKLGFGSLGGKIGIILQILGMLISRSKTFQAVMDIVNDLMQVAADTIGMLIEPLIPIFNILSTVLKPILTVIGQLLSTVFEPIFRALFPIIKGLGIAITFVAEVFQRVRAAILKAVGGLVKGLGEFLQKITFWDFDLADRMKNAGQSMIESGEDAEESADDLKESREDLQDMTYDSASEIEDENEKRKELNDSLTNAPQIFNRYLARREVESGSVSGGTGSTSSSSNSSGSGNSVQSNSGGNNKTTGRSLTIEEVVIVSNDPREIWRKLKKLMKDENFNKTGTTVSG